MSEHPVFQWAGNVISLGAIAGTIIGWLPLFAALVAIIWYSIQIWESSTVQEYVRKRMTISKAKKVARLRAEQKIILAQLDALETVRAARAVAKEVVAVAAAEATKQVTADSIEAETKI